MQIVQDAPTKNLSPVDERISIGRMWAHIKYWLWKLIAVAILAPIYVSVIAEGLRMLVPALGQKLHKLPIPGLATLAQYKETRRLDLAIFMASFLLAAVWWLWEQILRVILTNRDDHTFNRLGWNPDAYQRVVLLLGVTILGADTGLFYASVVQLGWNGAKFSWPAFLATAAYVAVIVFVSLVSLNLRRPFDER